MTSSKQSESQSKFHLICLHGFLGLASDWDLLEPVAPSPWTLHKENLWSSLGDFESWAARFCERMRQLSGTKVLLGYSMGGRLAMRALQKEADLFAGAILISANPGLKTNEEKTARVQADQIWAEKFRKLDWSELMAEWNSQHVFKQPSKALNLEAERISFERKETSFERELLAEAMELWSLGYQEDFAPLLSEMKLPVLLLTGAADAKFTAMTKAIAEKPSRGERLHVIVEGAGHRVPWDAPQEFRASVAKFLARWYR